MRAASSLLLVALGLVACGGSPVVRSAEKGDYPALRKELKAELDKGAFGPGDARDLARAVAKVDLATKEKSDVLARVRALSACAGAVGEPLETIAERDDEIGAVATLALVEAKRLGRGSARSRAEDKLARSLGPSDAAMWRAVLSRTLSSSSDGDERRKRLVDGDDDVRVAALRAAGDARDPADLDLLLEAARLDPLPLARTLAVRSLGELGGEKVTLALRDLWPRADEPLREAIVEAWSAPECFRASGQRELELSLAEGKGAPGVAAALALARLGTDEQKGAALGLLARTIDAAPSNQRVYAISASPLAPTLREPLWNASRDDDELVAIAAVNRLLLELEQGHDDVLTPDPSAPVAPAAADAKGSDAKGSDAKGEPKKGPPTRKELVDSLLALAKGDGRHRLQAKLALARAQEREVLKLLVADVDATDERARETAARIYAQLGDLPRAALGLTDTSATVRSSTVCAVLTR